MTIIEKLRAAKGKTLFTFEIMPPLKGSNFDELSSAIERLLPYKPAYINITNHRAERIGSGEQACVVKRRAGTAAIAAAIRYRYGIEVVPHVVCAGYSRSEVEDMLLDFAYLGIENVLALRGDAMRGESQFVPHPHGDSRAIDVLRQIMLLNKGVFIDPNIRNAAPIVEFCAGIAGYPEGHPQSDGEHADMQCLKEKADAGAAYIVTQMFFDNAAYFRFVERCLSMNINLPIIPGLKPLATLKHLEVLPSVFHIVMPEELRKQAMRYGASPQDVRKVGEEWCMRQCQELIANRVPALHFYTMSKAENVERVVSEVFNIKKTE